MSSRAALRPLENSQRLYREQNVQMAIQWSTLNTCEWFWEIYLKQDDRRDDRGIDRGVHELHWLLYFENLLPSWQRFVEYFYFSFVLGVAATCNCTNSSIAHYTGFRPLRTKFSMNKYATIDLKWNLNYHSFHSTKKFNGQSKLCACTQCTLSDSKCGRRKMKRTKTFNHLTCFMWNVWKNEFQSLHLQSWFIHRGREREREKEQRWTSFLFDRYSIAV